jgi:histidyl-tRNA synthetase
MKLAERRQTLICLLTHHLYELGYDLLDLPTIEQADLFLLKAGDRVFSSLFTFEDNDKTYALRPEFTAPALNRYLSSHTGTGVSKWQCLGDVFLRDSQGSPIQQYQLGIELIGDSSSDVDALRTLSSLLKHAGVTDSEISVGNIALLRKVIRNWIDDNRTEQFILANIPALNQPQQGIEYVIDLYDRISFSGSGNGTPSSARLGGNATAVTPNPSVWSLGAGTHIGSRSPEEITARLEYKMQRSAQRSELRSLLASIQAICSLSGSPSRIFSEIRSIVEVHNQHDIQGILSEWEGVIVKLQQDADDEEVAIKVAPGLIRAWDYYTGLVFDVYAGANRLHLGGGGRYDDLARLMGSVVDVPAIGFVLNMDNLLTATTTTTN